MRKVSLLFALITLCMATTTFGQKEETILGSRGLRLSGAWGGTKSQITTFGETNSFLNGGYGGLEFGNALFVGYGGYTLTNDVKWDNVVDQDFNFEWNGPILGYGLNNWKRVHPTFTLQAGQGKIWFREDAKDKVFVMQPSAGVELNVFRWFHIGLDGGYRFVTDSSISGLTDSQLSGVFGQLSLKFGYSWTNSFKSKKAKKPENKM